MTHHLLFLMAALAVFCAIGCEINPPGTAAKLKALQRRHATTRHHAVAHRPGHPRPVDSVVVSPEWMRQYKALEEVHGNYSIPDDAHSEVLPDGKVRVSSGQLKHYNDLIRAPVPEIPPPITGGTPPP